MFHAILAIFLFKGQVSRGGVGVHQGREAQGGGADVSENVTPHSSYKPGPTH